jgi:hypothetical protein
MNGVAMFKRKVYLFFLIGAFFPCMAFAQAVNDAGLWVTINLEKKINKRLELFLTQEYRRNENLTRTNLFYTDIGIAVKPMGFMKVSLSYRSIQKYEKEEIYNFRHRITLDVVLKKKVGKFTFSARERLQTQVREVYSSETGKLPEWYFRQKVEVKYDLDKPIKPYAGVEFRYQLHDPRNMELNHSWNRVRYTMGLDYKINEKNSCSLYYLIQNGFNVATPQNSFIIGVSYTLSL